MKGIGRTIKRRRLEAKTDYRARLDFLKSSKARLVVRKTNRYIIAQFVTSDIAKDKVVCGVTSRDLLAAGWPADKQGSLKSIAAAYLTGKLLASKTKVKEGILDIGMQRNIKKGRLYAVVRGLTDNGVTIPHGEDALPGDEELEKNENTKAILIQMKGSTKKHGGKGNKE